MLAVYKDAVLQHSGFTLFVNISAVTKNYVYRNDTKVWWLICAISYKRVFGAKTRKVARRKSTKWWFWRFFAWRPFAPPGKDTTHSRRKRNAWNVAYFRVAGWKVAMRKHEEVTIWRAFAWRLFAFSPRKHAYTTWHKSATIQKWINQTVWSRRGNIILSTFS